MRLPRRAPNFSPHFDLIGSEIVFSDLLLCAGRLKKKIESVKLLGLKGSLAGLEGLEDILGGEGGGGVRKKQKLGGGT